MPGAASFSTNVVSIATLSLLALQAAALFFDEIMFHQKRGLTLFERLGHPVDSLAFLLPLALQAWAPPTEPYLWAYTITSLISCLIVTKDEWIHSHACKAIEHWLHAILFLVHAPILIGLGWLWVKGEAAWFRIYTPYLVLAFTAYQIIYWLALKRPSLESSSPHKRGISWLRKPPAV